MNLKHISASVTKATDDRTADFICSTETVDGHGEIVKQNWKLSRYQKNPVVLWGHKHSELPIGTASNVRVEGGQLKARIRFVSAAANPRAEEVWTGVKEGSIRMVSVGFMPHSVRQETHDGVERFVLDDNELFEISVVPIGSNPDAVLGKSLPAAPVASPRRSLVHLALEKAGLLPDAEGEAEFLRGFEAEARARVAATTPHAEPPAPPVTRGGEALAQRLLADVRDTEFYSSEARELNR